MHLETGSEKQTKLSIFHCLKNVPKQATILKLFLADFLQFDLRPIFCNLTCPTCTVSGDCEELESSSYIGLCFLTFFFSPIPGKFDTQSTNSLCYCLTCSRTLSLCTHSVLLPSNAHFHNTHTQSYYKITNTPMIYTQSYYQVAHTFIMHTLSLITK